MTGVASQSDYPPTAEAAPVMEELSVRRGRWNIFFLILANAMGGSVASVNVTAAGLAGRALLVDDPSLATLPVSAFVIGVALAAWPASMIYKRLGRRGGGMFGTLLVLLGGVTCGIGIVAGNFWLLCLGSLVNGLNGAFVQQYRFAAAEAVPPWLRPQAIAWVMAGGVFAGFLGPQTVVFSSWLWPEGNFSLAFFSQSLFGLAALVSLAFLVIPNHQGAIRNPANPASPASPEVALDARHRAPTTSTPSASRHRTLVVAMICGACSFSVMAFVMTAAPFAMVISHGHSTSDAAYGIQWHVISMFAPGFITGSLIVRFGLRTTLMAGFLLLGASCVLGLVSVGAVWLDWGLLVLLGVGWNFAYTGATTLLATAYHGPNRARVQGINELIVFGLVAPSSVAAGAVFHAWGWETILWICLPIIGFCLSTLLLSSRIAFPSPQIPLK